MNDVCPRCGHGIPTNESRGAYPGALSRTTRGPDDVAVYICSDCGTREGFEDMAGKLTPQRFWLITPEMTHGPSRSVLDLIDSLTTEE